VVKLSMFKFDDVEEVEPVEVTDEVAVEEVVEDDREAKVVAAANLFGPAVKELDTVEAKIKRVQASLGVEQDGLVDSVYDLLFPGE
jgi:hypothetical protein